MAKEYKVFISHSWSHINDLIRLREMLQDRGYFNVDFEEVTPDCPINSDNSCYIRSKLRQKILNSDIVLGVAGVYGSYSEWMQWELDTANDLKIKVIGVVPWGQERVSSVVSERAIETVRWNTESIVTAIKKYSK
ncbi:MAG: TIR domain-containing protein [Bacteroidetes bacterium]|nr:TIR domain-containing protein [Bacteroidota bacterium]